MRIPTLKTIAGTIGVLVVYLVIMLYAFPTVLSLNDVLTLFWIAFGATVILLVIAFLTVYFHSKNMQGSQRILDST